MSWHFLERWIEKANQHSTLIGKFWITFLIVCRMVIVASVGDRVYSDEQSEFKCNTLQPGCTNVCFNKFSPISHLRFWSFQILLVATPSVMYVVYSAHVPKKKDKAKRRKKRELELLRHRNAGDLPNIEDDDDKGWKARLKQQANIASRQSNYNELIGSKNRRRRFSVSDSDVSNKNKRNMPNGSPAHCIDERFGKVGDGDPSKLRATLINYKYESDEDKYYLRNERDHTEPEGWYDQAKNHHGCNNNSLPNSKSRGMWKKPARHSRKYNEWVESNGNKRTKPISEIIAWGPPSSDDDYNRKVGKERSLVEADMYGKASLIGNGDIIKHPMDEEMVIPTAPPPPEYPGNVSDRRQNWKQMDVSDKNRSPNGKEPMRVKIVRHKKKPTFTRHFHLYLLNVFARLCFEVLFLVLQIYLYGFSVPELYKCQQWPCPNIVDCFISRPMEKTIFLYFMFIYSCICVLLNFVELKYLIWVYLFGRPRIRVERGGSRDYSNDQLRSTTSYGLDEYDSADLTTDELDSSLMTPGAIAEYLKYGELKSRKYRNNTRGRRWRYDKFADKRRDGKKKLGMMLDSEDDERDAMEIDIMQEEMANDDIDIEVNDSGSVGGDDGFA